MNKTKEGRRLRRRTRRRTRRGRSGQEKEDGHNGGHMPAGASRRRRVRRRRERLCAPVQRERKIMRCFCIIRYTDSLPAWRTGIRPEHPAGCNEKSPSIARGSTYFRVKSSPSLSLPSSCSSSPSGLNLRVSETGRAVPKARASRSSTYPSSSYSLPSPFSPPTRLTFRCLPYLLSSRIDDGFYKSLRRSCNCA